MPEQLSRRDFLKWASTLTLASLFQALPASQSNLASTAPPLPNIILVLFDALSAHNLSLYGYPRQTSPNLDKFVQRATVYHAHHTAGNFTTPSTASLFTSTYPWTHRAISLSGLVIPEVRPNNLFQMLSGSYYQFAFTQNIYADMLLYQFDQHLQQHPPLDSFSLAGNTFYNKLLKHDAILGMKAFDQFLFKREEAHGSLFLSLLNDLDVNLDSRRQAARLAETHPDGLPRLANTDITFLLEELMDGVMELVGELSTPFLAYFHLMPPHEPYLPTRQFRGLFDDGWSPSAKKRHPLSPRVPEERLNARRQTYDEFIANADAELGRLLDYLEKSGLLETSYVIITSDHGELFERGAHGHSTPLLFEPVIRVPLVISAPRQAARQDIYSLTSNLDLLPSLARLAGLPVPAWSAGQPLPGLGGEESPDRSLFVVEAKRSPARLPLRKASLALLKGRLKLVHYQGYKGAEDNYELYDLENDPDEQANLYPSHPLSADLRHELDQAQQAADQPFLPKK